MQKSAEGVEAYPALRYSKAHRLQLQDSAKEELQLFADQALHYKHFQYLTDLTRGFSDKI
jgi:hypothetical protein